MDLIKIGEFISSRRKLKNITQNELAERLGLSNKAISKWENGICLPDANNMPELCKILDITINDLFSGEVVDMKDNEKKLEENLLEVTRLKEERDKELLTAEIFIGVIVTIILLACVFVASFVNMPTWGRVTLIVSSFIIFIIGVGYAVRIEQVAGYYECDKCHYKYVPTYKSVLFATHVNRTRHMACPKCGKKSWQRKTLKK